MRYVVAAMRMEKLYKLRLKVIRLVIYTHANRLTRLNIWFVMFAEKVGQESQQRQRSKTKTKTKEKRQQNTHTMKMKKSKTGMAFFCFVFSFLLSVEEVLMFNTL